MQDASMILFLFIAYPETDTTPHFEDACAVVLATELLDDESCEDRLTLFDFDAVHFLEAGDDGLQPFPEAPVFSLVPGIESSELSDQCPELTTSSFDPKILPKKIFLSTLHLDLPAWKQKKCL